MRKRFMEAYRGYAPGRRYGLHCVTHLCNLVPALVFFFLMSAVSPAGDSAEVKRTATFGVVPQQSATQLAKEWTPFLVYLSRKTGYDIVFRTEKDIPSFEKACAEKKFDFAYMNPYHYMVFQKSPGYIAVARQEDVSLKGIVVVRKDSPFKELGDLEGKNLAFPSPGAFAASMIIQGHLRREEIAFTPYYVKSHDSVYRNVEKGLFPAGGGVLRTFLNMEPAVRDRLRILWTSPGYTPHAIAVRPGLPPEAVEKIVDAMVDMKNDPEGMSILREMVFSGIVRAQKGDWEDVRALEGILSGSSALQGGTAGRIPGKEGKTN